MSCQIDGHRFVYNLKGFTVEDRSSDDLDGCPVRFQSDTSVCWVAFGPPGRLDWFAVRVVSGASLGRMALGRAFSVSAIRWSREPHADPTLWGYRSSACLLQGCVLSCEVSLLQRTASFGGYFLHGCIIWKSHVARAPPSSSLRGSALSRSRILPRSRILRGSGPSRVRVVR